jgi:AcrR family transcriptional regulator
LRERKKAKTRDTIRRQALRLFREQGYEATTVEQIAAAAEVSPSTFFRYFPTKEDVILADDYDPLLFAAFQAQPPEVPPIAAVRNALREVFAHLSADEWAQERERFTLIRSVPQLQSRTLEEVVRSVRLLAELVAKRVGRRPDELVVRTFAGALIGVVLSTWVTWSEDSGTDYYTVLDAALAHLEAGLPL